MHLLIKTFKHFTLWVILKSIYLDFFTKYVFHLSAFTALYSSCLSHFLSVSLPVRLTSCCPAVSVCSQHCILPVCLTSCLSHFLSVSLPVCLSAFKALYSSCLSHFLSVSVRSQHCILPVCLTSCPSHFLSVSVRSQHCILPVCLTSCPSHFLSVSVRSQHCICSVCFCLRLLFLLVLLSPI